MYLSIDPGNGVPVYLQIIEQIKHAISIGVFEVDKAIPTIREIALELRVNPNTVAKAVKELEREGFVYTRVGKGSFVSEQSKVLLKNDNSEKAQKLTGDYIRDMSWLGYKKEQTTELINQEWDIYKKGKNDE